MSIIPRLRWLDQAWSDLGVTEASGDTNNPRILSYYRDAGHPEVASDSVAWCAAFVGACLRRGGYEPTGSLMARSYLTWGEPAPSGQLGAITVLSRGNDPTLGHVGFLVGETDDDVILLGGNQSDAVTVEAFPRTRLLAMRWPSQTTSSVQTREPSTFDGALVHVFEMEGGFTDDPYDPGGPTNLGITLATYAAHKRVVIDKASAATLRAELAALTRDTAREIYLLRYWTPSCAGYLPPALAIMHFDASVNHGVAGAARFLQQTLDVDVDGEIGPITLAAARAAPLPGALERYAGLRLERYRQLPHFWRFGRGWTRRVTATRSLALRQLDRPLPPLPKVQPEETPMTDKTDPIITPKWWGNSMTIWGTFITALSNVLPAIGPLIGLDITAEMIRDLGEGVTQAIQAVGGVISIILTIVGRMRAFQPLVRRDMKIKI